MNFVYMVQKMRNIWYLCKWALLKKEAMNINQSELHSFKASDDWLEQGFYNNFDALVEVSYFNDPKSWMQMHIM